MVQASTISQRGIDQKAKAATRPAEARVRRQAPDQTVNEQQLSRPRQRGEKRAHPEPPEPSQPVQKEQRLRPEYYSQARPTPASDRGFPRSADVCGAQEHHG